MPEVRQERSGWRDMRLSERHRRWGWNCPAVDLDHLRSLGIPLVSHNMGNVESSAVLLYLAADTRFAAPYSRFLLHNFHWTFSTESVRKPVISEILDSLDFDSARYRDIFNEHIFWPV